MLYRARVPRAPLDRFVAAIWVYRGAPGPYALERHMPTGTAQLIVNLGADRIGQYDPDSGRCVGAVSGTILAGVQSRFSVISTADQEYVAGVSFRPGGTVPFTRVPLHETVDRDVPVEELWGRTAGATLRERLLEAGGADAQLDVLERVLHEMWEPRVQHPAVAFALDVFGRRPCVASVADVTATIGLSPKRFIERFKADVGLTPKRYCRILRFQQALAAAYRGHAPDWSALAADCGYADQAHFIHEFRAFTGLTPTMYLAARTPFQNHVKFLQDPPARV